MSMRAFIAIDLDPGIKTTLQDFVRTLRGTRADVRWVEPGGMHLTLKFLGDVDDGRATRIRTILAAAAARRAAFPLRLEGTGAFPGERNPRVLWVGVVAGPGLAALQNELEEALAAEGFERETREFMPHLTLGRVKGPARIGDAMIELEKRRADSFGEMTVRRVALFESRLRPEGAQYRIVHEAELA
jgi:2'-5' RNA ligase